jgi:hypothetical protein
MLCQKWKRRPTQKISQKMFALNGDGARFQFGEGPTAKKNLGEPIGKKNN